MKKRVLILCTGNSCRSQMAEGFWRHMAAAQWDVFSAGLEPHGVNPLAIRVMAEVGIDISGHTSDSVADYVDQHFDLVVTVCGNADTHCPRFAHAAPKEHWPFEDPAGAGGSDEQRLPLFRAVRDQIRRRLTEYLAQAT